MVALPLIAKKPMVRFRESDLRVGFTRPAQCIADRTNLFSRDVLVLATPEKQERSVLILGLIEE